MCLHCKFEVFSNISKVHDEVDFILFLRSFSFLCLANNESVEALDLSWNHIRMRGAVAFCAGLKVRVHRIITESLTR